MELDDLISLTDAAQLLDISPSTLRHQAQHGRIHAVTIGKTWITSRQEVERYRAANLDRRGRPPTPTIAARVPWHDSMYRPAGTVEFHILRWPDADPADLELAEELARTAIREGAWTLAELMRPFYEDPRAHRLPVQFADTPTPLLVVAPRLTQFSQTPGGMPSQRF